MESDSGRRGTLVIVLATVLALAAACAGTEAEPAGSGATGSAASAPATTAVDGTVVDDTTSPPSTEPETTTTTRPRLPNVPAEGTGTLTEANPAVSSNPGRDVGVSVRLADGRYLWVFGDTINAFQVLSNSAGIAAPGSTDIWDHADGGGRLTQFIPYTAEEEAYNRAHAADGSRWVLWPNAAVPLDGGKKVLVFFERSITNLRPGGGSSTGPTGKPVIGTAIWDVTPPNDHGPIRAKRINDETFKGANLNTAYLDASGSTLWLISCVPNGRCLTAKVDPAKATDGTAWQWWTGRGFSSDVKQGIPMSFPDPESVYFGRTYPDGTPFQAAPWAGGHVVWDGYHGVYVFAFTSFPGYSEYGYLRVSTSPTGPWGPPVRFYFPECDAPDCYAVSVHPDLSRGPDTIGVSYHVGPLNHTALVDTTKLFGG